MLIRTLTFGSLLLSLLLLAARSRPRKSGFQPADPATYQRIYGDLDYLLWWVKGAPLSVPLISTGPNANSQGFLINSNTTILYGAPQSPAVGGKNVQDFGGFSGGRLTLGYAIDPSRGLAVEASGFGLESRSAGYTAGGSGGTPLVGNGIRVPLYNAVPYFIGVPRDAVAAENGLPVFIPGVLGGQVSATNRLNFWGLDATGVYELYRTPNWSVSALAGAPLPRPVRGFRSLRLLLRDRRCLSSAKAGSPATISAREISSSVPQSGRAARPDGDRSRSPRWGGSRSATWCRS